MDEAPFAIIFIGFITFMSIAFMIGKAVGSNSSHDIYRITCLELNLGKETCDKIFKKKEE
jgi:hypothetical protein